jgi:hypothetical protein
MSYLIYHEDTEGVEILETALAMAIIIDSFSVS